jgi:hypothetical protein
VVIRIRRTVLAALFLGLCLPHFSLDYVCRSGGSLSRQAGGRCGLDLPLGLGHNFSTPGRPRRSVVDTGPLRPDSLCWAESLARATLARRSQQPIAKEVLQKLGSCDTLLNRVLRRIVAGGMSSTAGACMSLDDLAPVVNFLIGFLHCLTPLPWDRDIDSLVHRARSTITYALVKGMMNEMAIMGRNPEQSTAVIQSTNELLFLMDKWKDSRWQRFYRLYLTQVADPDDKQGLVPKYVERPEKGGQSLNQSHRRVDVRQLLRARKYARRVSPQMRTVSADQVLQP